MPDNRTSFYYDPFRQGYDTNSWRTISGAPILGANGRLIIDTINGNAGSAVHYADIQKGDISFNLNIPSAPGADAGRFVGLQALNQAAYVRFSFGSVLTAQTSDGVNSTTSSAIVWDNSWTSANVEFRIRWEAGTAKFFIAGTQVAVISDSSVPNGPLSFYLYDDSALPMTVGDINARGMQSFVMNLKTSDTTNASGNFIMTSSFVTVSENVAMKVVNYILPGVGSDLAEAVTVSESITFNIVTKESISDLVTISENIALTIV